MFLILIKIRILIEILHNNFQHTPTASTQGFPKMISMMTTTTMMKMAMIMTITMMMITMVMMTTKMIIMLMVITVMVMC